MTVADALAAATKHLTAVGIDSARLDARVLLGHALGCSPSEVMLRLEEPVPPAFESLLARRAAREPVSRILGRREFWSLDFALTSDTLDPRPDTETLVAAARDAVPPSAPCRVLDLGTGSGCLLLAVLSDRPAWSGLGTDIAAGAIAAAKANAASLGLADRADFRQGDWDEGIDELFDLVLSNPPYIPSGDIAGLAPEVARFDPKRALDGGPDGLDAYRRLAPIAARRLATNGRVLFEHGEGQGDAVAALMIEAGLVPLARPHDLSGIARCVVAGLRRS
jgi:release factor glutamine methyltransferase